MAGRFLLLTNNHVRQQLVEALTSRGRDVVRAIDVFPERTSDEVLFAHAAATGRVFVSEAMAPRGTSLSGDDLLEAATSDEDD